VNKTRYQATDARHGKWNIEGVQCKTEYPSLAPSHESVPRSNEHIVPSHPIPSHPVHGSAPKRLRSEKADGQRPQRNGSISRILRTLATFSSAQALASEPPRTLSAWASTLFVMTLAAPDTLDRMALHRCRSPECWMETRKDWLLIQPMQWKSPTPHRPCCRYQGKIALICSAHRVGD
jgi:hypothetical protein